jgi:hypothetical protein
LLSEENPFGHTSCWSVSALLGIAEMLQVFVGRAFEPDKWSPLILEALLLQIGAKLIAKHHKSSRAG